MRVTVIKDNSIVGVDGTFRTADLSSMESGVRVLQWDGATGHKEFYDPAIPNVDITSQTELQPFIDLWTAASPPPPPEPTPSELIASAHSRISNAYESAVDAVTSGYPPNEIASWPKQEAEARNYTADNATLTPWIDSAAAARSITKTDLVGLILANADALAPIHGALTGKRQKLRDEIDALGPAATKEQLDLIQW
ncbi:MAG: hypothetical protein ABI216_22120 [Devosia sp.]